LESALSWGVGGSGSVWSLSQLQEVWPKCIREGSTLDRENQGDLAPCLLISALSDTRSSKTPAGGRGLGKRRGLSAMGSERYPTWTQPTTGREAALEAKPCASHGLGALGLCSYPQVMAQRAVTPTTAPHTAHTSCCPNFSADLNPPSPP
jgi:hypothetical protein